VESARAAGPPVGDPPGDARPGNPAPEYSSEETAEVSFRRFVAVRWGALQRYAYLLTGDQQTAEDVVQTALEKCWRRWSQIRADSPEAYVRAAVANTAASRRRRRRFAESPLDDVLHPPIDPGDHAETQALRSGLWPALAALAPRRRAVVVLRVWEDRSVAETAQVLGISTGAVKSQLSKAMAQLRSHPQVREAAGLRPEVLLATPLPVPPRPEVSR
jgi:RNA polymerase sigma-70 factor (sigma-E family)